MSARRRVGRGSSSSAAAARSLSFWCEKRGRKRTSSSALLTRHIAPPSDPPAGRGVRLSPAARPDKRTVCEYLSSDTRLSAASISSSVKGAPAADCSATPSCAS